MKTENIFFLNIYTCTHLIKINFWGFTGVAEGIYWGSGDLDIRFIL